MASTEFCIFSVLLCRFGIVLGFSPPFLLHFRKSLSLLVVEIIFFFVSGSLLTLNFLGVGGCNDEVRLDGL